MGQIGILEIVLEPKMYDRVFNEISRHGNPNAEPLPYCDWFNWQFSHDQVQIRKFGTKDKDFHHTGIENGLT